MTNVSDMTSVTKQDEVEGLQGESAEGVATPPLRFDLKSLLLRLIISVGLVGLFFFVVDVEMVVQGVLTLDAGVLILTCIGLLAFAPFAGLRWWFLLRGAGYTHRLDFALRVRMIGQGVNTLAPGGIAGDVLNVFYAAQPPERPASHLLGTLITDRLHGLIVNVVTLIAAALLASEVAQSLGLFDLTLGRVLILSAAGALVLAAVYFGRRRLKGPLRRGIEMLTTALGVLTDHARQPGLMTLCMAIGLVQQVLLAALATLLASGFGEVTLLQMLAALSIVTLSAIVPVTFNSLGVREAVFVLLLAGTLGSAEQAIALSLTWFFLNVVIFGSVGLLAAWVTRMPQGNTGRSDETAEA